MGSRIAEIVDYTAAVAARIEGVKSVAASGSGLIDDPLRPGRKIASAGSNPAEAFTHWSEVPGAPPVRWVSQSFTVELEWTIPMRLWLPKSESETRRLVLPFYDRYLQAFVQDPFFGERPNNMVLRTEISRFAIGGNADWSWLDVGLLVVERVNYAS